MVVLLLVFEAPAAAGNVCDVGGPGDAGLITLNGCNYSTLGDALDHAVDGDWIAVCQGDYLVSEVIDHSVTITAIDGPDLTRIEGYGVSGWGVLTIDNPGGVVVIDGFSIVGGDPGEPSVTITPGSEGNFVGVKVFGSTERGIEALPGADLVLTSSEVFGNAGGGVAGYGDGLLLLYGTWIYGNFAFAGGGLFVGDGREVYGGVVESNTADYGAGVYAMGSRLVGTQILGNGHAVQGGGIYGDHAVTLGAELVLESVTVTGNLADLGGGMYLEAYSRPTCTEDQDPTKESCEPTLSVRTFGTLIDGNRAEIGGGGIWHGAVSLEGDRESTISANTAPLGGGILIHDLDSGASPLGGFRVERNEAEDGGGILVELMAIAGVQMHDLEVRDNVAVRGGGIGFLRPLEPNTGFPGVELASVTVAGNVAQQGGAIYLDGYDVYLTGTFDANTADDAGGAFYLAGRNRLTCFSGTVKSNRAAVSGGGAVIADAEGEIHNSGCDWGSKGEDNDPADIETGGALYAYDTQPFDCDATQCSP